MFSLFCDSGKLKQFTKGKVTMTQKNTVEIQMINEENVDFFDIDLSDDNCFEFANSEEINNLIRTIQQYQDEINDNSKDQLLQSCRDAVINSILGPFGLSSFFYKSTQTGGDVTTLHNFKKGIASPEDQARATKYYEQYGTNGIGYGDKTRDNFDKPYHKIRDKIIENNTSHINGYSGHELEGTPSVDHIISCRELDSNAKLRLLLSDQERYEKASSEFNLIVTEKGLNSSKNDNNLLEWMNKQKSGAPKGVTNADYYEIDTEKAKSIYTTANKMMFGPIDKELFIKHIKDNAKSSAKQGAKMAGRMVLGAMLADLSWMVFDRIKTLMGRLKRQENTKLKFSTELKNQLYGIVSEIKEKYKSLLKKYLNLVKDSFISQLISTIVTFLINNIITTAKNIVSIIREGTTAIFRGIKLITHPDDPDSKEAAFLAGVDVIIAGLTTCIGFAAQDALKYLINQTPLVAFSDTISQVCSGLIVGVGAVLLIYAFHKLYKNIKITKQSIIVANQAVLLSRYYGIECLDFTTKAIEFIRKSGGDFDKNLVTASEQLTDIAKIQAKRQEKLKGIKEVSENGIGKS